MGHLNTEIKKWGDLYENSITLGSIGFMHTHNTIHVL